MSRIRILLAEADSVRRCRLRRVIATGRPFVDLTAVTDRTSFLDEVRDRAYDCIVLGRGDGEMEAHELLRAAAGDIRACPALVIGDDRSGAVDRGGSGATVVTPEEARGDELWAHIERAVHRRRQQRHDRRMRQRRLLRLAETDPRTGFITRRFFDRRLQEGRIAADRRRRHACVMIDIDRLRDVNDTHGHAVGDSVIQSVATILREMSAPDNLTVRWGAEEFLVLLSSVPLAEAWTWAERLRSRVLAETEGAGGAPVSATVSIGVTSCSTDELGDGIVDQADAALYHAKRLGRDCVATWPMAEVEGILQDLEIMAGEDVEVRRCAFLEECSEVLGPTQWHHVTTHCELVADAAATLGRTMGCDAEMVEQLRIAGLLHDIGKCVIPDELLAKPRPLSITEWHIMVRHADIGAEISERLGAGDLIGEWVRHHHTRFDCATTSHPDRNVPLGARVLNVADAIVTMASGRSYSGVLSTADTMREVVAQSGGQFDPQVVSAALGSTARLPWAQAA